MTILKDTETGDIIVPEKFETILGKRVNRIVIGTARVAAEKGEDGIIIPRRDRDSWEIDLLRYSLDHGLNFIDTARSYGDSEVVIGQAIQGFNREKIVIATKVGITISNPDQIKRAINESVERLMTPPDIIFVHNRWEGHMNGEMASCIAELDRAVDTGLAKGIGISNFRPDELEWAIGIANHKIEVYQAKLNLLNPRPDAFQLLQICRKNGIKFMASSALDRGGLQNNLTSRAIIEISNKYGITIPQLAISAILNEGVFPIVQSHNKEHIDQNLEVFDHFISKRDQAILHETLFSGQAQNG